MTDKDVTIHPGDFDMMIVIDVFWHDSDKYKCAL